MDFTLFISLQVGWMLFHHGAWACVCRSNLYCSEYILLCPIPLVVRPGQPLGKVSITCTAKNSNESLQVGRLMRFKDISKQTKIASVNFQSGKATPQYANETEWKQRSTLELEDNSTNMVLTVPKITFDDLQYEYVCDGTVSANSTEYSFSSQSLMIYAIPEPRVTLNVTGMSQEHFLLNCSAFNRLNFSTIRPGQIRFQHFNNGTWRYMPQGFSANGSDIGQSAFSVRHSCTIRVSLNSLRGCHHRFRCYLEHHDVDHMERYTAERLVDLPRGTSSCPASDDDKTAKDTNESTKLYMDLTVVAAVIVAGVVAVLPVQF